MRSKPSRDSKLSWTKTVVRKWLNIESSGDELHPNYNADSSSDEDCSISMPGSGLSAESTSPHGFGPNPPAIPSPPAAQDLRVFVGTWNVGGRSPDVSLDLKDSLVSTTCSADIYVLGFQEIVPLNAGNVLGAEDQGPADTWLSLIRRALHTRATTTHSSPSAGDDEEPPTCSPPACSGGGYSLAASKQMVGIFLCVWVRAPLMQLVSSIRVSCVRTGIMGYMGNKGSVSISMTLGGSALCFVCTHLTSGERDGDLARRNSDASEILKRTRFTPSRGLHGSSSISPATVMDHDKIIWLGDLNYRLTAGPAAVAVGCGSDEHELAEKDGWQALLEKDQLGIEQRAGRAFTRWEEGAIRFPPTYKYIVNSDRYAVEPSKFGDQRTPAWCDRILWRGKGMKQQWYERRESRFSDHRPVCSLFSIQIDSYDIVAAGEIADYSTKVVTRTINTTSAATTTTTAAKAENNNKRSSWGRVQAMELLLQTGKHSYSRDPDSSKQYSKIPSFEGRKTEKRILPKRKWLLT